MRVDLRKGLQDQKLVYLFVANRKVRYPQGSSAIVYIGCTSRGMRRITESVADRRHTIKERGRMTHVHVVVLTCRGRQRVAMWRALERALLRSFYRSFGTNPIANHQAQSAREGNELAYLAQQKVAGLVGKYSQPIEYRV